MACLRILMLILLLIATCSVFLSKNVISAAPADQKTLERLIDQTKQEINQKKRKEKSVTSNLIKQQQELQVLQNRHYRIKNQLSSVQQRFNKSKSELSILRSNLHSLELELDERQELFNRKIVAFYKYGPQSYIEILFNARDFADLISKYHTFSYIVRKDLDLMEELVQVKDEIKVQEEAVQAKAEQVKSEFQKTLKLQKEVSQEQQKITSKVKSAKQELAKIQSDRIKLEKALQEYEQTSKEIENVIRKDQERSGQGGLLGTGIMVWPVRGRISSDFGWRYHPVLKKKKYHNGLDLAVRSGTPVYAADSGIVLVSGWRGGYGNFVAIDHGNGISTCYGHNSRLLVSVGERVTKGEKIALSGSTGLSTGPHVHFEVRVKGVPVNPIPYLP